MWRKDHFIFLAKILSPCFLFLKTLSVLLFYEYNKRGKFETKERKRERERKREKANKYKKEKKEIRELKQERERKGEREGESFHHQSR